MEKKQCLFTNKSTNVQCGTKTENANGYCAKHKNTKVAMGDAFVPKPKKEKEVEEGAFYEWQLLQETDNDPEGIVLNSSPEYGLELILGKDLGETKVMIGMAELEKLLGGAAALIATVGDKEFEVSVTME